MPATKLLRFADLKDANIVTNWPQLGRLIEQHGFPAGYHLSPGCRVFDADKVEGLARKPSHSGRPSAAAWRRVDRRSTRNAT